MAQLGTIGLHEITADDKVELQHVQGDTHDFYALRLPGGVNLYFDGQGPESAANLVGFLDQLHTIASTVVQDLADSVKVVA